VLAGLRRKGLSEDLESLDKFGYIAETTEHVKSGIESSGGKR
jgi:hypothetical protein